MLLFVLPQVRARVRLAWRECGALEKKQGLCERWLTKGLFGYRRLDKNQLRGPIPTEIGQLTRNTNLALSENSLSGSLPTELALLATGIAGYPKL